MSGFCRYFSFLVLMTSIVLTKCDVLIFPEEYPGLIEEEYRDIPARFGPLPPQDGMRGLVVLGSPRDGCADLAPRPSKDIPNFTYNWIVLIARYNCSYEKKVRNAQAAGYDGVIVHNVNSSELVTMVANDPMGIKIPSVFVSGNAGMAIEYSYLYDNGFFVVINRDVPSNINQLLFPFAIVVVLCFIIMIIFLILRCVRERRRARRHRLPNSSLKKIPTCKFAKGDPYDTCAICLDDYVEGDKLRVLPCAHAYHCKCIDPWLTENRRVCPVCKRKVFAIGERRSRRAARESNERNSRDTNSESDTDDDRAPLVNSHSEERVTQGGTFERQRVNPFVRAARTLATSGSESSSLNIGHSRVPRNNNQQVDTGIQRSSLPESTSSSRGGPFLTGVLNLRGEQFATPNQYLRELVENERQAPGALMDSRHGIRNSAQRNNSRKERSNIRKNNPRRNEARHSHRNDRLVSHGREESDINQEPLDSNRSPIEIDNSSNVVNSPQIVNTDSAIGSNNIEVEDSNIVSDQGRIGVAALPNVNVNLNVIIGNHNAAIGGSDFIV